MSLGTLLNLPISFKSPIICFAFITISLLEEAFSVWKFPDFILFKLSIILCLSNSNCYRLTFKVATFSLFSSSILLSIFLYSNRFYWSSPTTPFNLFISSFRIKSSCYYCASICSISIIISCSFTLRASLSLTSNSSCLFLSYSKVSSFAFSRSMRALLIWSFSILALNSLSFLRSNSLSSS